MQRIILTIICLSFWNLGFNQKSFTLAEAIDYAIKHSHDLELDHIQVKTASAEIKEFKSIGVPTVKAGVDYNYYVYTPATPIQDFITPAVYRVLAEEGLADPFTGTLESQKFSFFQPHNLTGRIDATALLFDGSYLEGLKAARLFKELQTKAIAVTEQGIRSNVTKAYLNTLIININEKTLQDNIENIEKALFETSEIYKSGFAEQLDVDRIQLSLKRLEAEKDKIEQYRNLSKNLLKFQMNFPLDDEMTLSEDLETLINRMKIETVNLEDPIDYDKKAELAQINTGYELNRLNLNRIKKAKLPSVRLNASISEQLQRTNLFSNEETGFLPTASVGIGINVPIYDGGARSGQEQKAALELEKISIETEQFKKGVNIQIFNARQQYINAKKTLDSREEIVTMVQNIYDKTLIKYKEGVGSSIEVTQAESSLYQAQNDYINALYELLNAKIDLDIASGNL